MSISTSAKYQIKDILRAEKVFYLVWILINLFFMTAAKLSANSQASITGLHESTFIFLFVIGLCTFKEFFLFFQQNSVSRKALFLGHLAATVLCSLVMMIMNIIFAWITDLIGTLFLSNFISTKNAFQALYPNGSMVTEFFFYYVFYLFVIAAGYFLTVMFYRLSKVGKIVVGAGVPIALTIIFPLADTWVFKGNLTKFMLIRISRLYGFMSGRPWIIIIAVFILSAAISFLTWLMIRRAVIKE